MHKHILYKLHLFEMTRSHTYTKPTTITALNDQNARDQLHVLEKYK